MRRRRLAVLGAGGRLGARVLALARQMAWEVVGVGLGHDLERTARVLAEWQPAVVWYPESPGRAAASLATGSRVVFGRGGYQAFLELDADLLVVAVPTVEPLGLCVQWIEAGRQLVVASKELLVAGGHLLKSRLRVLDSELSALTQLLELHGGRISGAILPASGGRLWGTPEASVQSARPEDILGHPVWDMGPKITVDSATFVNKVFEVLVAETALGLPPGTVRVAVHPECLVHAAVALESGQWLLAVHPPDMDWAVRWALGMPAAGSRTIFPFGELRFLPVAGPFRRALALLEQMRRAWMSACLVGADTALVRAFLRGEILLGGIWDGLEAVAASCGRRELPAGTVDEVLAAVDEGYRAARRWLAKRG